MLSRVRWRSLNNRRGVAAVELAVLLPFMAFIFVIAVDFCRIFFISVTIDNCARNGAQFGSHVANTATWQNSGAPIASIQDATTADGATLNPPLTSSNVAVANGNDADGHPMVRVSVNYQFQTLTAFPGIPTTVNLLRTAQMRVAPQAPN